MAQHHRNNLCGDVCLKQEGCVRVPKVMETNPRKAAGIQDTVEVPDQKTGTHKRAVIPEKEALRIGLRLGLPCPQALRQG